ncbi:MAG: DNA primase [Phycisphaerales bacterium]|nr:DNA primase [Phycisphaerales bacterium]
MPDQNRNFTLGDADKEKVRAATDIVRLVGEHVALKPKGREYVGLCPFHDDHSPSMNVVPSKQIFHCFVCGSGGDAFTFVQKLHRMEFREAIEYLAQRAGIELTPRREAAADERPGVSRRSLMDAGALAVDFFRTVYRHNDHGRAARAIVDRRGITPEMVEQFQIGAAPSRDDGLLLTLRGKKLPEAPFVEAGLIKRSQRGEGFYDGFRNRLMFPIHDMTGRVIAFGARRINDEDEPKYLNSPESPVFKKSGTLYAIHHASRAIQTEGLAIIAEGYTDAIACHQAGFRNVVATLGTALTRDHARVLRRLCSSVTLLFDGDSAGQKAAERAIEVLFAEPIDVRIAMLDTHTDAKDPDELLKREGGAETLRAVLAGATDVLDYRFARLAVGLKGAGIAALSRAVEEQVERLVELGLRDVEPIRQKLIVRRLAQVAGVDEATIARVIPGGRASPRQAPTKAESTLADIAWLTSGTMGAREHLLGCILCDGSLDAGLASRRDFIAPTEYRWPVLAKVADMVNELSSRGQRPDLAAILRASDDDELKAAAVALAARIDRETDRDTERLHEHWRACLHRVELDQAHRASGGGLMDTIELKRRAHALGADRRVLPRPGEGGA